MKKLSLTAKAILLTSITPLSGAYSSVHEVVHGDTLSQIAESRYKNWIKWKDLWQLNRDRIKNPDLIFPGQKLRMLGGEEAVVEARMVEIGVPVAKSHHASGRVSEMLDDESGDHRPHESLIADNGDEWRLLPKQKWETFVFQMDPAIDPDGFDRRSRTVVRVPASTTPNSLVSNDRIPVFGEIVGARSEYDQIFMGEQVLIRASEQLQIGTTYAVTEGPEKLTSPRDNRTGFAYEIYGKVRIVGVRDGVFIGTVSSLKLPIERGFVLIEDPKVQSIPRAIAAPSAVKATVMTTKETEDEMLVQGRVVFLDVGKGDGIEAGMVFRKFVHTDPYTKTQFSTKDFLVDAELQVITSEEKFSSAVVLQSSSPFRAGVQVSALTDLSDFGGEKGFDSIIQRTDEKEVDELDKIEDASGIGEKEDKDLQQLENYKKPSEELKTEEAPSTGADAPAPTGAEAPAPTGTRLESSSDAPKEAAPVSEKSGLQSAEGAAAEKKSAPSTGAGAPAPTGATPSTGTAVPAPTGAPTEADPFATPTP